MINNSLVRRGPTLKWPPIFHIGIDRNISCSSSTHILLLPEKKFCFPLALKNDENTCSSWVQPIAHKCNGTSQKHRFKKNLLVTQIKSQNFSEKWLKFQNSSLMIIGKEMEIYTPAPKSNQFWITEVKLPPIAIFQRNHNKWKNIRFFGYIIFCITEIFKKVDLYGFFRCEILGLYSRK